MRRFIRNIIIVLSVAVSVSCIENDLSYPDVAAEITGFSVEGQKSVTIDKETRTISIVMGETADLHKVAVTSCTLSDKTQVVGGVPQSLDLTEPVTLTIRLYDEYVWTITAVQPIERYIRCENQAGDPEIDPIRKTAYVYVVEQQDLLEVVFTDMKLEPEGSVVRSTVGFISEGGQSVPKVEECSFPMTMDCVVMRYFYVEYKGEEIEWAVKVLQKAVEVGVESVTPWTCNAIVQGVTNGKGTSVIEYRKDSDAQWSTWTDFELTGTAISADITGLEPNASYLLRITNGEDTSAEVKFTTGAAETLPNLGFDDWYKEGSAWMPNAGVSSYIWDSANPGTAGLGIVPTVPEESDVVKGKAARLETMTAMGMLAAGNIYVGQFGNIAGLGAELDWGYPFSGRPLALKGYYKYSPKPVDMVKDPYKDLKGQSDQCQIQILLTDWSDRFHINTSKKKFVDFENDRNIIAHGSLVSANTDTEYVEFTIPLVYRNLRMPKYIVIVGAASRYGDYFTGGKGSVLKLDEFELVYDPRLLTAEEYQKVFAEIYKR